MKERGQVLIILSWVTLVDHLYHDKFLDYCRVVMAAHVVPIKLQLQVQCHHKQSNKKFASWLASEKPFHHACREALDDIS